MKRMLPIALILLMLAGCSLGGAAGSGAGEKPSYRQIDQETARSMMKADDGHAVVDVRRQDEYDAGHIPGAILIPNESITTERPEKLPDLHQIILVYCRSGNRSKQAAQKLAAMGYTEVYEFGGILDWTGPTVRAEEEALTAAAPTLVIEARGRTFYAAPEDNSSAAAFVEKLSSGPIEVELQDLGNFGKAGPLPWTLPQNDAAVTTVPGDIILYQGNRITVCCGSNTLDLTRLAKIEDVTRDELLEVLGSGSVTASFRAEWSE